MDTDESSPPPLRATLPLVAVVVDHADGYAAEAFDNALLGAPEPRAAELKGSCVLRPSSSSADSAPPPPLIDVGRSSPLIELRVLEQSRRGYTWPPATFANAHHALLVVVVTRRTLDERALADALVLEWCSALEARRAAGATSALVVVDDERSAGDARALDARALGALDASHSRCMALRFDVALAVAVHDRRAARAAWRTLLQCATSR